MNALRTTALFLALATVASAQAFKGCSGNATYTIKFFNLLTPGYFGDLIPGSGLVFSPLTAVSHSNRVSLLTVRGFASKEVEEVAETGNNGPLLALAERLRGRGVRSAVGADGPTLAGNSTAVMVAADCAHPFVTVLGMIAPSPDWLVQVSNRNVVDAGTGAFVGRMEGDLIAYDAGVDDGREFTPPGDASLDEPTVPQKNIAPLVEDETDRFEGRVVGRYIIERMD